MSIDDYADMQIKSSFKVVPLTASLALVALSLMLSPTPASAKGGGGHGGTQAPATPILSDFGPVGSLTPQGVYDFVKINDAGLAATTVQIQTNAPTDLHYLADINVTTGVAVCNELSAYVYSNPANANVRIFAQGHTGAIWGQRIGVDGVCAG